ncbi:primosomal protein N' [Subtercola sp. YIM 133946]|uniref:primosomal protein N' family DNA-binding protein n=1 Tax=Subtercola sp. YIM 133946 TaxID=3118909 RepID=UPI002F9559CE
MLESPLPQLDRLFDYRIPETLVADARPGVRVKVPLRTAGRVSRGYIIEVTDHQDFVGTLSDVEEVVSPLAVLTPEVWALARRVADRAAGNVSDVVRLAVPPRQVRVEKAWLARQRSAVDAVPAPEDGPADAAATAEDGPADAATAAEDSPAYAATAAEEAPAYAATAEVATGTTPALLDPATTPAVRHPDARTTPAMLDPDTGATPAAAAVATDGNSAEAEAGRRRVVVRGYGHGVVELAIKQRGRFALDAVPTVTPTGGAGDWVGSWAATMAAMAVHTLGLGRSSILVVPDYRDQEQLETALRALLAELGAPAPAAAPADGPAPAPTGSTPSPAVTDAPSGTANPAVTDAPSGTANPPATDATGSTANPPATGSTPSRAAATDSVPNPATTATRGATSTADVIARLDARQTNPERYANFLACLEPTPRIIVGTRSAIYAPAHDLGLIALWDEADPLHDEPLSPYVSSRDAALIRQEQSGAALAFVAHSRSTEVQRLVELGFLAEIAQSPRILPKVIPTSAQASTDRHAQSARIPSSAWNAVRKALETGPVLVQVARPGYSPVLACADCTNPAHCLVCDGPLRSTSRQAPPSCAWCGAIAAAWQCRTCEGTRFTHIGQGSTRTAEELGRAFPATRVIVSDGSRSLGVVGGEPALVVATRGAEPVAHGGYHAVLLLDGERMLARESLTVAEDCLRWWANAIALAAPRKPTIIVGVGGELARTLVTWQHARFASGELVDRRRLRFPPAVRVATVRGTPESVAGAVNELHDSVHGEDSAKIDVLGPVPDENDFVRSIVRFDYSVGALVAATLRAAVIKNAANRRKTPGRPTNYRTPPTLRVRFDDREILE